MTRKEARQMEKLLKQVPPKYDFYNNDIECGYRLVSDNDWYKMVLIIIQLQDMYFKKLYSKEG